MSNRPPGLPVPATELAFTWRAPSLRDRAQPGALPLNGPVVLKATLARHPLAVSPDQVDVGLVQVSYTLA